MNEENKEKLVAQKEEGKSYFLAILITLLAGLSVGFVLGILFSPKPGKEIRKDIKDKSEEFIKKSKEGATDTIDKTKEFVEKSRGKFKEVKGKGKELIKKSKEKVEALKEIIMPKKEEKEENKENTEA